MIILYCCCIELYCISVFENNKHKQTWETQTGFKVQRQKTYHSHCESSSKTETHSRTNERMNQKMNHEWSWLMTVRTPATWLPDFLRFSSNALAFFPPKWDIHDCPCLRLRASAQAPTPKRHELRKLSDLTCQGERLGLWPELTKLTKLNVTKLN